MTATTHPDSVSRYDLYDPVRLQATFLASDGLTSISPSQVHLFVRNAQGSVATYLFDAAGASIVAVGSGAFYKDITVDQVGSWFYRFQATGFGQAVEEWSFLVDRSNIFDL